MASERAPLVGPDGKTVLVHLVVNVEHWRFDAAMPRKVIPAPHGAEQVPDVPNFAWAEYGMRCGLPRLLDMITNRGLAASTSINAGAIAAYPSAAEAMRDAGWEFIGHGIHQRAVSADDDEAARIGEALGILEGFTGKPVRGWLSPGLRETADTPDHLKAAGIDYVCDWVLDDLPCWMATAHGPLMAMPYALEVNDSVVYAVEHHAGPEMERRLRETLSCFVAESGPHVLAIGLHPHLIAVPHRIASLARMLDLLQAHDDVVFMTGSQIADWYAAAEPAP
ncbi:MAG: polysaccharide deacetylase family protein [Alphaproteobacteria bacterium]|nr:polysaccharide deacetylase family protein [Alphaproteobacteria bacterium]